MMGDPRALIVRHSFANPYWWGWLEVYASPYKPYRIIKRRNP